MSSQRFPRYRQRGKEAKTVAEFRPNTRGKLNTIKNSADLHRMAPESPRPIRLLDGLAVISQDDLTAGDQALYELLISTAYAADKEMAAHTNQISSKRARAFLGDIRRAYLEASLHRLTHTEVTFDNTDQDMVRRWGSVPMLLAWLSSPGDDETADIIHYTLPEPVRQIMAAREPYRHLELAAVARMRSRYGIRLYRMLLARTFNNGLRFEISPQELADCIGYAPSSWHYGQFRLRCLDPAIEDLHQVTHFAATFTEIRGRRRGSPVDSLAVEITMKARSHYLVPTVKMDTEQGANKAAWRHIIRKDLEPYRVSPRLFLRARTYWNRISRSVVVFRNLWDLALNEALLNTDIEIDGRLFRGKRLLDAIKIQGADNAAWGLFDEEARNPDLSVAGRDHGRELSLYRLNGHRRARLGGFILDPLPRIKTAAELYHRPTPTSLADEAIQLAEALKDRSSHLDTIVARSLDDAMDDIARLVADLDRKLDGRLIAAIRAPRSWLTHALVDAALRHVAGETGLDEEIADCISDIEAMPVAA